MKRSIVLFDSNTSYIGVPLPLLAITALLDTSKYNIHIITKRDFPNYKSKVLELCENAICLGVTCITGTPIKEALEMSQAVKNKYPDLPVIWGGWQAITLPDITLKDPAVDYICTGRGERTFSEFIAMLESNDLGRAETIQGLCFKKHGKIVSVPYDTFEDINNFPDYNLDLINWENHLETAWFGKRLLRVNTSYGCPYRCRFCCEQNHCHRSWTALSAERIIDLLVKLRERVDFDSLVFADNNFFVNQQRVVQFCKGLIENNFHIKYGWVCARTNELTKYKPESWKLLQTSGLKNVLIGAESASNDQLQFITKDTTVEQTIEATRLCDQYGVKPLLSVVMGFPTEQYLKDPAGAFNKELEQLYFFFKDIWSNITHNFVFLIYFYTPLPSSPMFKLAVDSGYKPPQGLIEWTSLEYIHVNTPWFTPGRKNLSRLKVFKYMIRVLCQDYETYIKQLPFILRAPARILFVSSRYFAGLRLKHDYLGFPLDQIILNSAEKSFQTINKVYRMINMVEYNVD